MRAEAGFTPVIDLVQVASQIERRVLASHMMLGLMLR